MHPIQRFWSWTSTPTGSSIPPTGWTVIGALLVVALLGAAVGEATRSSGDDLVARIGRSLTGVRESTGYSEWKLRVEFWSKAGAAIVAWSLALVLAILLRLLATPGLDTNVLPALVLGAGLVPLSAFILYRLMLYPRFIAECGRIDTRTAYVGRATRADARSKAKQPSRSKQARGSTRATDPRRVPESVMPGIALIGMVIGPLVYYFLMLPHPRTVHDLHQVGMLVAVPLGYAIGLAFSLGQGVRSGSFWAPGPAR